MIGRLSGKPVVEEPNGVVIVDVAGVGYELSTPVGSVGRARRSDGSVSLSVHTHVREDALELFGFASDADRAVFRLLISVPNVGPRTALGVMSALPTDELASAVASGNVARLCKVPGIGKKTAERLVLELKGKLPEVALEAGPSPVSRDDRQRLLLALTNMGYRAAEAERAVKALDGRIGVDTLSKLLRDALKQLTP